MMPKLAGIFSPLATYFGSTIAEPMKALCDGSVNPLLNEYAPSERERREVGPSLLELMRKQQEMTSPEVLTGTPAYRPMGYYFDQLAKDQQRRIPH